ncbi:MAG: hypothetical protein J6Y29_02975 [Clostridiales bacterium]|nr:hypothetical protein [Clostridiales bacterium]
MQSGQKITLDFAIKNSVKIVSKQNDIDSRYLIITLKNNRQAVTISPSATVVLNITRLDGEKKCYRAIVENNVVIAFLSDWALELEGIIKCDISIIENGERLTTMPFKVDVVFVCCNSDDIEDSTSEDIMTELIQMLGEYEGEKEHLEQIDSTLENHTNSIHTLENSVIDNTANIAKNSSDIAILETIVDKLSNPITSQIITITRDDWIYNASINKYECTIEKDTVTPSTYIIVNEYEGLLVDAEIESNNGSYTITALVKPTGAVNLLLIFLKGG